MSTLKTPRLDKDKNPVLGADRKPVVDEIDTAAQATDPGVKSFLANFLVKSGRANKVVDTADNIVVTPKTETEKKKVVVAPVARDAETEERAEGHFGEVLGAIEGGVVANQKEYNRVTKETVPLSHAVSGHGKGSDQVSRLVDGRRAGEILDDKAHDAEQKRLEAEDKKKKNRKKEFEKEPDRFPAEEVTLTGNAALGDVTVPKYATVGHDPGNTSGAFNTNRGMLHAVTEAFAQADVLTRHAEQQRKGRAPRSDLEKAILRAGGKDPEDATLVPDDDGLWALPDRKPLTDAVAGLYAIADKEALGKVLDGAADEDIRRPTGLAALLNRNKDALGLAAPVKIAESEKADAAAQAAAHKWDTAFDKHRFATVVTGPDAGREDGAQEPLGYNLAVEGYSAQRKPTNKDGTEVGVPLAKDEMQERFKAIKKTTAGIDNAQVVLDPAYTVSEGEDEFGNPTVVKKQVGWNLQTAYATPKAAADGFINPEDARAKLKGSVAVLADKEWMAKEQLAGAKAAVKLAKNRVEATEGQIEAKLAGREKLAAAAGDTPVPAETVAVLDGARIALEKELGELNKNDIPEFTDLFGGDDFGTSDPSDPSDPSEPAEPVEDNTEAKAALQRRIDAVEKQITSRKVADIDAEIEALKQSLVGLKAAVPLAEEAVPAAELAHKEATATRKAAAAEAATGDGADDADDAEGDDADADAADDGRAGGPSGYNPATGEYDSTKRPPKPDILKGTDEKGNALTAHHLYPWNKIREDLNAALRDKSQAGVEKVLAFGGVKASSAFWKELQLEPAERSYKFGEELNRLVPAVCWAPANIFMGPGGRGDDPDSEIDAAFAQSGLPTPASAAAELMARGPTTYAKGDVKTIAATTPGGGLRGTNKLVDRLLDNIRDVHSTTAEPREKPDVPEPTGQQPRPYKPEEWTTDGDGKPVRVGENPALTETIAKAREASDGAAQDLKAKAEVVNTQRSRERDEAAERREKEAAETEKKLRQAAADAAQEAYDRKSREQEALAERREKAAAAVDDGLRKVAAAEAQAAYDRKSREEDARADRREKAAGVAEDELRRVAAAEAQAANDRKSREEDARADRREKAAAVAEDELRRVAAAEAQAANDLKSREQDEAADRRARAEDELRNAGGR